jgi:hypothetical protein
MADPTQIGIEVRVPKPKRLGRKAEVCKDLVIWPRPGMTCWTSAGKAENYPLAVLEWKLGEPRVSEYDVEWLRAFSLDSGDAAGYAICANWAGRRFGLRCTRVHHGSEQEGWLVL